ncbi:NAD(P)/FAD-dependent oxidoreductase [Algivirga pacifica]|uniref:NAD(P)/FAD-dependent oxidoreductase n=1 Tax=Algivirga pacifica TaxID=1162670 RepID=A0ABP9DCS2_9BACT
MLDFIIVGGGQAGLSMAYHLQQLKQNFLIVDKEKEVGASWLNRWDSLKLFTPTEFNHLVGYPFPAPKGFYPNKWDVANYFKEYVSHFNIPIQLDTLVTSIEKKDDFFELTSQHGILKARNVIISTGPFHTPYTPPFANKITKGILQIHSNYYKNPESLQEGATVVVGAGDSGFQILEEIANTGRTVYYAGETNVSTLPQTFLGKTLWWWFTKTGFLKFNKYSWIGKRIQSGRQPVIGTDVKKILRKENIIPVGRAINADEQSITFEKDRINNIKNIVWATGYRPNFSWIQGLELDKHGYPKNHRGVSAIEGLYFIGLPWMHTRSSATLGGVSEDAAYLADIIQKKRS